MSVVTDMFYKKGEFYLERGTYGVGGNLAVKAYSISGEFYGLVSVNIPGEKINKDEAFLDTNNIPDIDKVLQETGVATYTGENGVSGYCTYPKFKFDLVKLDLMQKEVQGAFE